MFSNHTSGQLDASIQDNGQAGGQRGGPLHSEAAPCMACCQHVRWWPRYYPVWAALIVSSNTGIVPFMHRMVGGAGNIWHMQQCAPMVGSNSSFHSGPPVDVEAQASAGSLT